MADISHRTTSGGASRWRVRYRTTGGRGSSQRVKTFTTEEKAIKFAGLVDLLGYADAERMLTAPAAASERTVAEQVAHHIEHLPNITTGTRSDYVNYSLDIVAQLGPTPLSMLTRDQVTKFAMWLRDERHLGEKSIKHRHGLLSSALKSAVRADLLMRNVAEGVELPRDDTKPEMVVLTLAEIQSLLECAREHWRPLIATLVGTGMRIGEATALQVGDIDLEARTATIRRAWKHTDGNGHLLGPPKSPASNRTLHLGSLVHLLAPLMKDRPADAWLFTNTRGGVVRYGVFADGPWTDARRAFAGDVRADDGIRGGRRRYKWAKGPGKHPRVHDMRHTYASIKIKEGKSLAWLQKQLGHESIETTVNTYGHLLPTDLAALGDIIDWTPLEDRDTDEREQDGADRDNEQDNGQDREPLRQLQA